MARIRSIKPEYWSDRSIARQLSRDARLLYIALWNFADEHGRLPGDPRWVKGNCLPYDDDLDPEAVEQLLEELAAAGKVIEYQADGDPYLFLPNLARHQRLEAAKVPSRLPPPGANGPSPRAETSVPDATEAVPRADQPGRRAYSSAPRTHEPAPNANEPWPGSEPSLGAPADRGELEASALVTIRSESCADKPARGQNRSASGVDEPASGAEVPARIVALQVAGGMEQVVPPPADGADAPRSEVTAQQLIAEYVCGCAKRPPSQVLGQLGKHIAAMLAEGIDPDDLRRGLASWHAKGLHPSTLPSVVHEAMNGPLARGGRQQQTEDLFARAMHRARARDGLEATS